VKKSNKVLLSLACEMVIVGVSTSAFSAVAEADGYKGAPIRSLLWAALPSSASSSLAMALKEHVPPCVILVINDNPYGLMFALSYICRTCP
jgi:hypothetical protein